MKRKFWKGALVLIIAIFLIGTVAQPGTEKTSEQKRIELLRENSWLKLSKEIIWKGDSASFDYSIFRHSDGTIEECVMVRIFPFEKQVGPYRFYDLSKAQYHIVYGKGSRMFQVEWSSKEMGIEVVIYLPEMKCDKDLSKEVVKEIVERGTFYYVAVRKYFKVDTYKGLKEVIEREKSLKREGNFPLFLFFVIIEVT